MQIGGGDGGNAPILLGDKRHWQLGLM